MNCLWKKKILHKAWQLAKKQFMLLGLSLDEALVFFYNSEVYQLIRDGVSDMHCMSDAYLADELEKEYNNTI